MADDLDDVPETSEEDGTLRAAADRIAAMMAAEEENSTRAGADEAAPGAPAGSGDDAKPPATAPEMQQAMERAAIAAKAAEVERERFAQALSTLVPQVQAAALANQFPDVRSMDDLQRLAQTDTARYNQYVFTQMRLQQAQNGQRAALAELTQRQAAQQAAWREAETAKLNAAIPELSQGVEGAQLSRRLREFALKSGYTPQDLAQAGAKDFIVLHKAMRLAEIEAARGAARDKARSAPAVQRPGTHSAGAGDKFRSDLERLQKSGRVDDAAAVFQNLLFR